MGVSKVILAFLEICLYNASLTKPKYNVRSSSPIYLLRAYVSIGWLQPQFRGMFCESSFLAKLTTNLGHKPSYTH